MQEKLKEFKDLPIDQILNTDDGHYIHCGFELEYHDILSIRKDKETVPTVGIERATAEANQRCACETNRHDEDASYLERLGLLCTWVDPTQAEYTDPYYVVDQDRLRAIAVRTNTRRQERIQARAAEPVGRHDDDNWQTKQRKLKAWGHKHLEFGYDGSVRGGEIRTNGPKTIPQFKEALETLLQDDFEVDTGCSFHIHLSIPGVQHKYGERMQAEMVAYLIDNLDRIPGCIKKRLLSGSIDYFKLVTNTDKYTAVHYHEQGTWEFRLFGNLATVSEGMECLMWAIKALQHAYRARSNKAQQLVPDLQRFDDAMTTLRNGKFTKSVVAVFENKYLDTVAYDSEDEEPEYDEDMDYDDEDAA